MDPNSSRRSNCEEPAPPGTSPPPLPSKPPLVASLKGVENAKKRLRAFSIQKKTTPLSPIIPKPISTGTTTVLIGKLSSVKTTPKVEEDPLKKLPKPPKPGAARKYIQDSYSDQQKRTLSEIEDMKRKMELVDLGIPLGLICPTSTEEKAMPTKAMPPIKTFLDPAKVDELIREAKKAKVEGREFKFDYKKILPDYDNPFQRKQDEYEKEYKYERRRSGSEKRDRKTEKHEPRRHSDIRKDDKYKERDKDKPRERFRTPKDTSDKESDVNLKDFLVCDSWSENDDKANSSSPRYDEKGYTSVKKTPDKIRSSKDVEIKVQDKCIEKVPVKITNKPSKQLKVSLTKKIEVINECSVDSPTKKQSKIGKLQPVIDCFKFEIDPNEEILDIFDEDSGLEKFSQVKPKPSTLYSPPGKNLTSYELTSRDMSMDGMYDDTFLESVINEIRQDNICDETSPDKRLVEYDESPNKDDYDSPLVKEVKERMRASVTPELDEKMKERSKQKSDAVKKASSSKQKDDYYERKESVDQRVDYSDRKYQVSQRSDSYDRKDQNSQRSDNSDRKDQDSQRSDYSDRKDQGSLRSDYSDRKDQGRKRSDYSDRKEHDSQLSNYSDGRQSTESGYKTSDTNKSDTKYVDNFRLSIEKELDDALQRSMNRSTVESLETWSFVLKICQPLLFRHDKNKCYRETHTSPKLWYTENPKVCTCVKDRAIVYEELEMLKMGLVDRVYGCDQLADTPSVNARAWYPPRASCLAAGKVQPVASEWEADDSQQGRRSLTPQRDDEVMLDREYQRFMQAVWPDVKDAKASETSRSTTPVRQVSRRKKKEQEIDREAEDKKVKKIKLSSEGWSQESDIDEDGEKSKKIKIKDKEKSRKRKRSTSTLSSITESDASSKKKRKLMKKKAHKKEKSKEAKRRRIGKQLLKKLKEKQKQKKKTEKEESEELELEEAIAPSAIVENPSAVGFLSLHSSPSKHVSGAYERKKEVKKMKRKRQPKLKRKKGQKRRKKDSTSSSTDSSTSSEGDIGVGRPGKSTKRSSTEGKKKRDKRKSSSESHSEDLFDVNILNNIKTERLTDDEKCQTLLEFSPRIHHKPREIINVKELQNDFVGNNNILIKKEAEDPRDVSDEMVEAIEKEKTEDVEVSDEECPVQIVTNLEDAGLFVPMPVDPPPVEIIVHRNEFEQHIYVTESIQAEPEEVTIAQPIHLVEPQDNVSSGTSTRVVDESNLSQCSSQESVCSVKETSMYEKDESHLRPSSQNSNYSFNDVIASQSALYHKEIESTVEPQYELEQHGSYEMYEQLAMAYQSDVASLALMRAAGAAGGGADESAGAGGGPQRIETVVRARARGEIKCDWRADRQPAAPPANRPSRWGLKPGDVNIVLTGGELTAQPVYRIQSLANRTDVAPDYDEAYMDMYGASDRLQYGDCFAADVGHGGPVSAVSDVSLPSPPRAVPPADSRSTLDARIDQALRNSAISEMAMISDAAVEQKDVPEKGILFAGAGSACGAGASVASRGVKRVSFADGYQPGQDSDLEEPPLKKRRRARRSGCAWPCPASHPDHVPLWDALPPPPPPPGDPPRSCRQALRRGRPSDAGNILGGFMPPEPPPGLISF